MKRVSLKAPVGTTECNYGTHLHPIGTDRKVDVSPAEAEMLIGGVAGFVLDEAEPEQPNGHVRVFAPEGTTSVGFGGEAYEVGSDGWIIVPAAAAAELHAHGFTDTRPLAEGAEPEPVVDDVPVDTPVT